MDAKTALVLLPEFFLVLVATGIFVAGAFLPNNRTIWAWVAGGGILGSAAALAILPHGVVSAGALSPDSLARYVRWLSLASAALFVTLVARRAATSQSAEYQGCLLLAIAGMMLVSVAGDLVLMFAGLELISLPTYVLLYLGGRGRDGQEATAKYFYLSILASALLLYGFSFLYGAAGSTRFPEIVASWQNGITPGRATLAALGMLLAFAGLGFKMAAVPFHFYAPDVYQGTSNENAALLSVVPKIGGLVALVRIGAHFAPVVAGSQSIGWMVALILAVMTMTLGNVLALWQDNIRRLLAYSSIAHAGYMLTGMAAWLAVADTQNEPTWLDGVGAALMYVSVYTVATIGTFAVLVYLGRSNREVSGVDELAGLVRHHPIAAVLMALFMFSLAGIPPLAGFQGKLLLFSSILGVGAESATVMPATAALRPWFVGLAIAGVLNAAIAAAYYLRIIDVMFFRPPIGRPEPAGGPGAATVAVLCGVLVLAIGIYPAPLMRGARDASQANSQSYDPALNAIAQQSAGSELAAQASPPLLVANDDDDGS